MGSRIMSKAWLENREQGKDRICQRSNGGHHVLNRCAVTFNLVVKGIYACVQTHLCLVKTRPYYVPQAGLNPSILLSQPPECLHHYTQTCMIEEPRGFCYNIRSIITERNKKLHLHLSNWNKITIN